MAQRSTGIFPREGFNLDEENKASGSSTEIGSDLTYCETVRVIAFDLGADNAVSVEGVEIIPAGTYPAQYITHVRGALLPVGKTVTIAGTNPEDATVYFEKVS